MDWSLHFDDDATTPRGEDRLLSSRATRGLTGKNYGAFVCFCFALNYVIGPSFFFFLVSEIGHDFVNPIGLTSMVV